MGSGVLKSPWLDRDIATDILFGACTGVRATIVAAFSGTARRPSPCSSLLTTPSPSWDLLAIRGSILSITGFGNLALELFSCAGIG